MEYVDLSDILKVSRIIQGLWRLPSWDKDQFSLLDHIERILDLGITTFDNANIYGDYTCEARFGDSIALDPGIRKKMQLITKCGIKKPGVKYPYLNVKYYDTSKDHIIESVHRSLLDLKTDYIDLLLLHRPDPYMDPVEVAETFHYLKKSGKVLNFGVSNFKPASFSLLQKFVLFPLVTNQVEISPLNLTNFDNGTIEQCQEYEIPPMAWSPLAKGEIFSSSSDEAINVCSKLEDIAEKYDVSGLDTVIYAFLLSHPAKIIPIVGTSKIERLQHAIKALDIKLTREEWFEIYVAGKGKPVD